MSTFRLALGSILALITLGTTIGRVGIFSLLSFDSNCTNGTSTNIGNLFSVSNVSISIYEFFT